MNSSARILLRASLATAALASAQFALGADFFGKNLSYLGGGDTRPCIFFQLSGVSTADPALPNVAWFVLPKTHPQFKESYALLLSAKLTGQQINISTTGAIDPCGHAQVASIGLPQN